MNSSKLCDKLRGLELRDILRGLDSPLIYIDSDSHNCPVMADSATLYWSDLEDRWYEYNDAEIRSILVRGDAIGSYKVLRIENESYGEDTLDEDDYDQVRLYLVLKIWGS